MNRIRIRYEKLDAAKYISHLDMTRVFDRCIRRSRLPISFSKGFNPRPNMNFALPTSVGISSLCEFAEFELEERIDTKIFVDTLNSNLPAGIKVVDATYVGVDVLGDPSQNCRPTCALENPDSLMSLVTKARYKVTLKYKNEIDISKITTVFNQNEIIVTRISPKKTSDVDIKPMIIEYSVKELDKSIIEINILCLAGSRANLRPELVVLGIEKYTGIEIYDYIIEKEETILE